MQRHRLQDGIRVTAHRGDRDARVLAHKPGNQVRQNILSNRPEALSPSCPPSFPEARRRCAAIPPPPKSCRGARPQLITVHQQRQNSNARPIGRGRTAQIPLQAASRTQPNGAISSRSNRGHGVTDEPIVTREGQDLVASQTAEAVFGGDPDVVLPILKNEADEIAGKAIPARVVLNGSVPSSRDAENTVPFGGDPDTASTVGGHGRDR